jgi:hypothetical protein
VWLPGLISSATDYLARLPGVTDREEAIELAHEAIAESWSFLLDESRSTEQKVRRLATTLDAAGKRARVTQKRHRKLLEDYAANLRYFTPVQSLEEQIIQKDHVLGVVRVLQHAVADALHQLPPRDRDLLVSSYGLEDVMLLQSHHPPEVSLSAARKAMRRALSKFGEALGEALQGLYQEEDPSLVHDAIEISRDQEVKVLRSAALRVGPV